MAITPVSKGLHKFDRAIGEGLHDDGHGESRSARLLSARLPRHVTVFAELLVAT